MGTGRFQTFQQFLATQSAHVPVLGFMLSLFLTALLSFSLARIYVRHGTALSNRRMFANNFVIIATTTMFIITVIKSSLALSLGLVGALSIVRFRAAIKEPEELAYLFLNIAIGLGMGADQHLITIVAFCMIVGVIILRSGSHEAASAQNTFFTITNYNPEKGSLEKIVDILKKYSLAVDLKRVDETKEVLEASFLVEFKDMGSLHQAKQELHRLSGSVKVTFLDNKGVM